ncbi:MAG: DNA primase [Acidobacteria bacterium]|nr:DNA primase [Acidobacteriota bacterium]
MKFPQTFIDEVRSAADIVVVISDYVSLRKAGASYKGLCPFHGEKSPSFTVNRDRGFFHCFGCGVGGDVFKFIELKEQLGFGDALRQLAQRFGIPIPELETSEGGRDEAAQRESLLKVHEVANAWFREQLASPPAARIREYLRDKRRLTDDTVARLQLGYAPPGRDNLRQHLLKAGFPASLLQTSGLVSRRDDGSEVDRFRNRLMVPIARDTGSVIAFGGRALEADQVPKYLNSPETPIYTKGRTLYGLNLTKGDIRKRGFTIIVEGYFDYAQVFQAGGLPVVATCGTALTNAQAQQLRRFAPKAVLCYDADNAGQNAAERSSELLVGEGFDVNVVRLPGGDDPDTFIQKEGRDGFVQQLKTSRPYLDFLLDRAAAGLDLSRDEPRREFLSRMLAVAARIPDPAARDQFADKLAHRARITEGVVRAEIRKAAAARKTELPADRVPTLMGQLRPAEKGLLWGLVHDPAHTVPWLQSLQDTDLEGLTSAPILRLARDLHGVAPTEVPNVLMERLSTREAQWLAAIASESSAPVLDAGSSVTSLQRLTHERELSAVQRAIDAVQAGRGTPADLDRLLQRKLALGRLLKPEER